MNAAVASRRKRRRRSANERDVLLPSRTAPVSSAFTRRTARLLQERRRLLRRRGRLLLLLRSLPVRDLVGNSSSERSRWVGPSCRRRKWLRRSRSRLQPQRKRPTQMTGMLGSNCKAVHISCARVSTSRVSCADFCGSPHFVPFLQFQRFATDLPLPAVSLLWRPMLHRMSRLGTRPSAAGR